MGYEEMGGAEHLTSQDPIEPTTQIRTIEELLAGRGIEYPRLVDVTFKPAPKAKAAVAENLTLALGESE
jgi:hypothetical protein